MDPYGAFGDKFFKMYNFDLEQNTRISKISYLNEHYKDFDSYIIGGSKSGAFIPETVNKYYKDAKFYNLNMINGRFFDYEKTVKYIVNNYHVKNIILQISQLEADEVGTSEAVTGILNKDVNPVFSLKYYGRFLIQNPLLSLKKLQQFLNGDKKESFYNISHGSFNYELAERKIRENPQNYFSDLKKFPIKNPDLGATFYDYNLAIMKEIVDFCKAKNVNLLVIASPTYKVELDAYKKDDLSNFMVDLAQITDYWNFSGINSINVNVTNFYNNNHFRLNIAEKMLARIFEDKSIKIPSDFGKKITAENSSIEIMKALNY